MIFTFIELIGLTPCWCLVLNGNKVVWAQEAYFCLTCKNFVEICFSVLTVLMILYEVFYLGSRTTLKALVWNAWSATVNISFYHYYFSPVGSRAGWLWGFRIAGISPSFVYFSLSITHIGMDSVTEITRQFHFRESGGWRRWECERTGAEERLPSTALAFDSAE